MSSLSKLIFSISEKIAAGSSSDDEDVKIQLEEAKNLIGNSTNFHDSFLLQFLDEMVDRRVQDVRDLRLVPFEILVFLILSLSSIIVFLVIWFKKENRTVIHLIDV